MTVIGTAEQWTTTERAARRIARAFGYGRSWPMDGGEHGQAADDDADVAPSADPGFLDDPDDPDVLDDPDVEKVLDYADEPGALSNEALAVVKRGRVMRGGGAARSITGADGKPTAAVHALRYWNVQAVSAVWPVCRMDTDALGAMAALSRIEQAMLLVYAGELQHWPMVARWCMVRGHRIEAACAAMDRILWARPDRTLEEHAFRVGMRKGAFCALVRLARAELERLLFAASAKFAETLCGNRKHPANCLIGKGVEIRRPVFHANEASTSNSEAHSNGTNLDPVPGSAPHGRRRVGIHDTKLGKRARISAPGESGRPRRGVEPSRRPAVD